MASRNIPEPLPKVYYAHQWCNTTEGGSFTLDVPAGSYIILMNGKTQKKENAFMKMWIDDTPSSDPGYLGYRAPTTNNNSSVLNISSSCLKTWSSAHTITINYSENWYSAYIIAIKYA